MHSQREQVWREDVLDVHDDLVQQLTTAKLALELNQTELGMRSLAQALEIAKSIISGLIDDPDSGAATSSPGGLRRKVPTPPAPPAP